MKRMCRLYLLIAAGLLPVLCFAQNVEDVDSCIAELNAKCPFEYKEGWMFNSVTSSGDTVRVEIQLPSLMGAFLHPLTENTSNVRRLWTRQMSSFGKDWRKLVNLMITAKRSLVLILVPEESTDSYSVTLSPDDLNE